LESEKRGRMGDTLSTLDNASTMTKEFDSTAENDYNPFGVPAILLNSPSEFNPGIAMRGCPPMHMYTRAEFASLPIEKQAAYADGVVRGSYEKEWMTNQLRGDDDFQQGNVTAIGGLAFVALKTTDASLHSKLNAWIARNQTNVDFWP
jgi:hypothetical protein